MEIKLSYYETKTIIENHIANTLKIDKDSLGYTSLLDERFEEVDDYDFMLISISEPVIKTKGKKK